jgi:extracellular elastinolytic metalloproteinase
VAWRRDGAYFYTQFYRGGLPLIDEPVTPGLRANFCEHLLENLILSRQEVVATDHTTMSGFAPEDEGVVYRRECEHIRIYYEFAAIGSTEPGDVFDPRNALLQLMVAASPHETDRVEILNNHYAIRENMTSHVESDFSGENFGTIGKIIDNVPDAVSPVKAKPVYFQLPDGDETILVQAWLVSHTKFYFSCTRF